MLTTGHEYMQTAQMATDRYEAYVRDASTYRSTEYDRYHSRSGAFCKWLGDLLLQWGRVLRERDGETVVAIALQTRGQGRDAA